MSKSQKKVMGLLHRRPSAGWLAREIAEELGVTNSRAQQVLRRLVEDGWVLREEQRAVRNGKPLGRPYYRYWAR
jgi:DNA-binding MarR family transcriptional regulator